MRELIDSLAKRSAARAAEGDYVQDGLLYCGHCNTPKQCRIVLEDGARVVGCQCACAAREYEARRQAERDRERRLLVEDLRVQGIQDRAMRGYTFQQARELPELEKCREYVRRWPEMLEQNNGLLFWGDAGRGKTYAAACIANALIDKGVPVLMTSFPRILNAGWDKTELAGQMRHFPLLVIDDLGAERESAYALETVYLIVDERYKTGKPLIVTTNLSLGELQSPKNMDYKRIYQRILEMCVPVVFKGASIRQEKAAVKLRAAREIFR